MSETPSAPAADDLVSRVLAGRYRVERHLRRGGMGAVYVARDLKEDRDVAVKVVRQALLEDPQALARFRREARLVTELSHDNIVRSFDAGDDAGLLWIAMELLDGESLRDRLDARGRIAWADTLPLVEQVAQALGAAHDQGIIHRDLKPENIMLVQREGETRSKLLDFGVAKQAHVEGQTSGTSNMTGTGLIVGTPGYVAPEVVLEGTTDDPRSDFYALGVVWFEMLTGQKPFTAKTAFALAMRHAHEPAPTPTSLVPYSPVPAPIERVVLRLLAKNPNDRPKDARELLISLATLAEESQKSLAGTPPPSLLDGNPHDATVTDLADIHSTGVVPFKTPKPAGPALNDPLHASRPDMTGTGTPATAQHLGGGGMTPPGATPLPQLLGQIPKKYFAAALFMLVALIACVSIAVLVVAGRVNQDEVARDTREGREGRKERERDERKRDEREAREAREARQEGERLAAVANAIPPPPSTPPPPPSTDPPADDVQRTETKRAETKRNETKRTETKRTETKRDESTGANANTNANANAPGKLFVRPLPVEGEWTISVKGGYPLQSPLNMENAAAGSYPLVIESKKLGASIKVTVEVKPGESTRLVKDFRTAGQ